MGFEPSHCLTAPLLRLSLFFLPLYAWLFKAKSDKNYFVPQGDEWLKLDDKTGTETFYLLASPHVIENIDQKISRLKTSGIDDLDKLFPGVTIKSFRFKHDQKSD